MAHRGRLNVLAHNLGRRVRVDLRRVRGSLRRSRRSRRCPQGGTGDVKYHHGAEGTYQLADRRVGPRQPGVQPEPPRVRRSRSSAAPPARRRRRARARMPTRTRTPRSRSSSTATPPSRARASSPRRSTCRRSTATRSAARVHMITNNQVGFTTDPDDAPLDAVGSDLAKGFDVPIIHVNADDVGGLHQRRPAGVRLPPGVRPRRADRPDRLPPLRPQRGRRAGLHAARDVPARSSTSTRRCASCCAEQLVEEGVIATEDESTEMTDGGLGRAARRATTR